MTLSVVGAMHPNADGGNRLFEIAMCAPGEPVSLVPESKNKHDPSAVAVFSARGTQFGYVSAERCGWIGARIRMGEEILAVFQEPVRGGALIRISFSGEPPFIPRKRTPAPEPSASEYDDTFYPDEEPPDEW
jgi:hypothetical protein